jgi:hypothetical protein
LAGGVFPAIAEEPKIVVPCAEPGDCSVQLREQLVAVFGLMAWIDPAIAGVRLPSTEELRGASKTLLQAEFLSRSHAGLFVEVLPDGTRRVDLQGRFMSGAVVTLSAAAELEIQCGDGSESSSVTPNNVPVEK